MLILSIHFFKSSHAFDTPKLRGASPGGYVVVYALTMLVVGHWVWSMAGADE